MSRENLRPIAIIAAVVVVAGALVMLYDARTTEQPEEVPPPAPQVEVPTLDVKNVILMISDGMGYYHIDATEIYENGRPGTSFYSDFPVRIAMTTFAAGGDYDGARAANDFSYVGKGYTDSAAAGTAMASGTKTYAGAIGVDENKDALESVLERAEKTGRKTGVVTSVQWAHATPASFVAHNESRQNYAEIAKEMLLVSAVDVVMGAGHPEYDNNGRLVEGEREYKYVGGHGTWLDVMRGIAGADADGDGEADPWTLIQDHAQFEALQFGDAPERVLGVPRVATTLQQSRDIDPDSDADEKAGPFETPMNRGIPTLAMMTRGALNVLDDDPDGLFLMVEGGAVDWASHANQSGRMIEEQIDFNHAVQAVIDWVEQNSSWDETLLIVTSDHECGHLAGPGSNPEWTAPVALGIGVQPKMAWYSGDHTNSLVPLFAQGRGSDQLADMSEGDDPVRGEYLDNTDIPALIFRAFGGETAVPEGEPKESP